MATVSPMLAGHGHSLQSGEALAPAAQGAALFMTVIVATVLLAMAVGIFLLVRRARRGETPEQALLREIREESRRRLEPGRENQGPAASDPKSPQEGWEKDPDWWKGKPIPGKNSPEEPK